MSRFYSLRQLIIFPFSCMIIFCPFSKLAAQKPRTPIPRGHQIMIKSKELNLERSIWIYLPDNYSENNLAYPVLYMNNAENDFQYSAAVVDFLAHANRISQLIVVAVVDIDPSLDFTYPADPDFATNGSETGGADQFIDFFKFELIPYIEKNYRTVPYRLLMGNTLGGLFASYTFITEPNLFDSYICLSPLLWWDNHSVIQKMADMLDSTPIKNKFFYMAVGADNERTTMDSRKLADVFSSYPDQGVRFTYVVMENESRSSVALRSLYSAVELLYAGWELDKNLVLDHQLPMTLIDEHYTNLSQRFGYEILPPEALLNELGYGAIRTGAITAAIRMFEANVENNPTSPNAFDSLGDGYTAAGNLKQALKCYQKSVKLGEATNDSNLDLFRANVTRTMQNH